MIRVEKDLENIPNSLFDKKTITRRDTCIRDRKYHKDKKFDQRYKQKDIKESLKEIYSQKCAFCEQKIIECRDNNLQDCSSTIEHYRPKSIYYWLAFSWDNLLWCCHRCNQYKSNSFEMDKQKVQYHEDFKDNIHSSANIYNAIEYPKMIHPELESVLSIVKFERDGSILSSDERVEYTIETCGLNRVDLIEKRKKIIDDFIKKVNAKIVKDESIQDVLTELFYDFKEQKKEFIALKFWILKNYKSLIKVS